MTLTPITNLDPNLTVQALLAIVRQSYPGAWTDEDMGTTLFFFVGEPDGANIVATVPNYFA